MIQFRPALWMSILLVLALAILCSLGVWQVKRLHWKNDLIAKLHAAQNAPAEHIVDVLMATDDPQWRRVSLRGKYVADLPPRRLFRTQNGITGFRYLQAFGLDNGRYIYVDRGFSPKGKAVTLPPVSPGAVVGFLHPAEHKTWLSPAPEMDKNIWYWRDITAMAAGQVDVALLHTKYVVDLEKNAEEGNWPKAVGAPNDPVNNHLDYALTWFGLALSLFVIYLIWHVQNGRLTRRGRT